ncbi:MAG: hypothetical protein ACREUZ_12030 [Burkholderiales bacterium]
MGFLWNRGSSDNAIDRGRTRDFCVRCPACSFEIRLAGGLRLPPEFSVLCPGCGRRKVYRSAETYESLPDARVAATPRRTGFGKKTRH